MSNEKITHANNVVFFRTNKSPKNNGIKKVTFTNNIPSEINNLINVISKKNPTQTGVPFDKFIDLVNENSQKIKKLTIVSTSYLYRHYQDDREEFDKKWVKKNQNSLSKLTIPLEIISWKQVIESENYVSYLEKVVSLYEKDNDFKEIVNKLSVKYSENKDLEASRNYLLEECAGSLVLKSIGSITYPGKLNDAIQYTFNKVGDGQFQYIKYRIRYTESVKSPNIAQRVSNYLNSIFLPKDKQEEFFKKFVGLCEVFQNENNCIENTNEINGSMNVIQTKPDSAFVENKLESNF